MKDRYIMYVYRNGEFTREDEFENLLPAQELAHRLTRQENKVSLIVIVATITLYTWSYTR